MRTAPWFRSMVASPDRLKPGLQLRARSGSMVRAPVALPWSAGRLIRVQAGFTAAVLAIVACWPPESLTVMVMEYVPVVE